jgi:RNA polymerase sigma-70 factor (ECF subfamily)
LPSESDLPARLGAVLAVLYLIYNTGADHPERGDLRADAVRLARSVASLMPDEPEAAGLLALLLLNEARRPARGDGTEIVLLRDQDRATWDQTLIAEGHRIVRGCTRRNRPGPYQLQAAIQAVHRDASSFEETDWRQIVSLYDQLVRVMPTPVVGLNRAIALAEADGPRRGITELDALSAELNGYHLLHATRGTLLRRLGDTEGARLAYERARAGRHRAGPPVPLEADRRTGGR